jgi:hypothetical protein
MLRTPKAIWWQLIVYFLPFELDFAIRIHSNYIEVERNYLNYYRALFYCSKLKTIPSEN